MEMTIPKTSVYKADLRGFGDVKGCRQPLATKAKNAHIFLGGGSRRTPASISTTSFVPHATVKNALSKKDNKQTNFKFN